mgnify:CR=1 FL=1|jgi:hypothetical protein
MKKIKNILIPLTIVVMGFLLPLIGRALFQKQILPEGIAVILAMLGPFLLFIGVVWLIIALLMALMKKG